MPTPQILKMEPCAIPEFGKPGGMSLAALTTRLTNGGFCAATVAAIITRDKNRFCIAHMFRRISLFTVRGEERGYLDTMLLAAETPAWDCRSPGPAGLFECWCGSAPGTRSRSSR